MTKENGNSIHEIIELLYSHEVVKGWAVVLVVENEKDKIKETKYQIIDRIYWFIVGSANLFY